ncbi:MAG: hypothetical protein DMG28_18305 [Acidobacteria bacterium]|nr:MAG: hypothetical protein DMG28_18305 [Acidobacteriota bacterium]
MGAYLTGKREIVLPSETLLTFHVTSVKISPKELSRLQRAGQGAGSAQESDTYGARDSHSTVARRRHHRDDEDEGEDEDEARERVREGSPESEIIIFTRQERVIVTDWFRTGRGDLPPGLAKRDRLPPGLEKHLRERGSLPPGLQKRMQPLPFELERQLHRLPTGYRRVVIGGNVILMNEETSVVYDIIRDAIP